MMPLDQRHFPSLGFGKRNYGHRPHGGASGHMRGSAVFQELQVIREFKSGDLYSFKFYLLPSDETVHPGAQDTQQELRLLG